MDALLDAGLAATGWLQGTFPQLAGVFDFISQLGIEEFYLALIPLLYWCVDKRMGKHLAYVFLFSTAWNGVFKHALRGPRPYWLDAKLELWSSGDYGVPSGHAQLTATIYPFIAAWLRKAWAWVLAVFMVIAMGLSRIYLGAHFIHDVVLGILIAIVVLIGYAVWQQRFALEFGKRILGYRLLVTLIVPTVIALVYTLLRLIIGSPNESVAWASFIPTAEVEGLEAFATAIGSLLGAGVGLTLEGSRVRFLSPGTVAQKIGRYVLGILVTLALWRGLGLVFPADPLWLGIPLRIIRYFLMLVWVSFYAPMLFVRLKLAQADPEPQITMTPP